jgi:hypothetical protein
VIGVAAFTARKKGTRRAAASEGAEPNDAQPRSSIADVGPVWITAIAGLVTALAGAIALFGPWGDAAEPTVEIAEARSTESSVSAEGTYAGLEGDSESVVILVRRAGTDDRWTTVEADRVAVGEGEGDAEEGEWTVGIPLEGGPFEVMAVIVPAPRGGGFESTIFDELHDSGPEAEMVRARSEPVTVEGA